MAMIFVGVCYLFGIFAVGILMGMIGVLLELGMGISLSADLSITIGVIFLAIVLGAMAWAVSVCRLRDLERSRRWLLPAAISYLVFVFSASGVLPMPQLVEAGAIAIAALLS